MYEIDGQGASDVRGIISEDEETIKQFLDDKELLITDLKALIEAEKVYKDREAVKYFLNQKVTTDNVAEYLDMDADALDDLIEYTDTVESIIQLKRRAGRTSIPKEQLVALVLGTVRELKQFVQETEVDVRVLDELLESERDFKDRKTAKRFLITEIRGRSLGEYLDAMEMSYDDMKNCISALYGSDDQTRQDEERFELEGEVTVERLEKKILEQERRQHERLMERLEAHGYDQDELEERSISELRELLEEAEQQGDDTDKREELIQMLTERGLPEDDLRQSSTTDLEKLLGGVKRRTGEKDHEEIMDEARADLETIEDEGDGSVAGAEEKLKELLISYRDRNPQEAALKTAYLMRGYIIDGLDLGSGTTYRDAAEELPESHNEHMERLDGFLREMHRAQYAHDGVDEDMQQVIDSCLYVIDHLEFSPA